MHFLLKSIFSKVSCDSQDIIQNISLEIKQMSDYRLKKVKAVSQEGFWVRITAWPWAKPSLIFVGRNMF